ncbi:MAG: RNA pseudouridine synthase [Myxococcales bacterium]|nr:RNA pseudouridine synthase [Myxococcales bacterium]
MTPELDWIVGADEDAIVVVAERDGIVLAAKPAGIPTEPERGHASSLVAGLAARLGGATAHAATRLDLGVSGLVVATLGPDAARRFERLRQQGHVHKRYLAVAHAAGALPERGTWDTPLGSERDGRGKLRASARVAERRRAVTHFERIATAGPAALLGLVPETGRMHQLRAHAALAGAPLYGDRLYGGPTTLTDPSGTVTALGRVLLHAFELVLEGLCRARAPVPAELRSAWRTLGGADADWPAG